MLSVNDNSCTEVLCTGYVLCVISKSPISFSERGGGERLYSPEGDVKTLSLILQGK